jgi:hypothetical protein
VAKGGRGEQAAKLRLMHGLGDYHWSRPDKEDMDQFRGYWALP